MNILLSDIEARVLGSLVEKEITTPDYYPLSLNALLNACNQKSNRDPVMDLDEEIVAGALQGLNEKGLAEAVQSPESRVTKYEHRLQEAFNFYRHEIAVLCVLLLRGSQTPGELRGRSERMHPFEDLDQIQSTLQRLMKREPPLVKMLPRQPGTKEARYAHLLSGDLGFGEPEPATDAAKGITSRSVIGGRMARCEEEIVGLRRELADLKQQLADFRKQFE